MSNIDNTGSSVDALSVRSFETIELATRVPLPPSTSTISLKTPSALNSIISETELVRNESSLAPVDRGFGAWSFLAAAFLVETIVWGFPNAFGVFLNAYLNDPYYSSQDGAASLLPLIGPLSSGIMYCSGSVIYPFTSRYPQHRRTSLFIGAIICWASLFGASYATKVHQLVACQGILYAIGGSLLYAPCISYMSEWFVERRGLANGVMFAGTATGGLILPLILPKMLHFYGPSKSLRILSIAIACCLVPLLPFVKGRLPHSRVHGPAARSTDRSWLKNNSLWFLFVANTMQSFGYFVPILWLPTFAGDLHLSDTNSSLTLAVLNGASVLGRLSMGVLSDKFDAWALALSTLFLTALATFILWGVLSNSFAGLLAFGIAYGVLAGGWSSLWNGFVRPIAKDDLTLSTSLFGYLMLTRGIGNILSTPISTSLLRNNGSSSSPPYHHDNTGFAVGEGRFENMIIYVGACFSAAAMVVVVGWGMERARARARRT